MAQLRTIYENKYIKNKLFKIFLKVHLSKQIWNYSGHEFSLYFPYLLNFEEIKIAANEKKIASNDNFAYYG